MKPLDYINIEIYGNTVWQWCVALVIAIAVYVAFRLVQKRGLHHIKKLTRRDYSGWSTSFLEALEGTKGLILLILALYAGASWLDFPDDLENNFRITAYAAFFVQLGLWVNSLLNSWIQRYRNRHLLTNPSAVTTVSAMRMVLKGLLWLAVLILILDNIGFDITALVAGLGIGGIAVALALQNILGDLFSSLSIVLDKTFAVGDFLIIGEHMGTVENIGLKTTRVRSLSGEQIIFSNSDLLQGRIRNYGRMYERRVAVKIGVIYQTPREKLRKIPEIIREAIEAQEQIRFDRSHFQSYGDYSLNFEYVYYILSPDYNLYMDINQEINFAIHEEFEKESIEFSYLTRTAFIEEE